MKSKSLVPSVHALSALPEGFRAEWDELAEAAPLGTGSLQASPAWIDATARTLSPEAEISLMALRGQDGALRGVFPLMINKVRRGPTLDTRYAYFDPDRDLLRERAPTSLAVKQVSSPLSNEIGCLRTVWLSAAEDRALVMRSALSALAGHPGWSLALFCIDEALARQAADALPDGRTSTVSRHFNFRLHGSGYEPWLAGQSQKFRQNLRRADKARAEAGAVVRRHEGREAVMARLADFAGLAERSWKGGPLPSSTGQDILVPYAGRQRAFVEHLTRMDGLHPILSTVEHAESGHLFGAMISVVFSGETYTLLMFVEQGLTKMSPGHLLLRDIIEAAPGGIDFNSTASWTERYLDGTRDFRNVMGFAPTLSGTALRRGTQAVRTATSLRRALVHDR